jgi:predicted TIM-barrel fold metal-dependent hydrolase
LPAYKEFLEQRHHEKLDAYISRVSGMLDANARMKSSVRKYMTVEKFERMRAFSDQVSTDNVRRIKELEADNVVGEVLFADGASVPFAGPFGYADALDGEQAELVRAGQRAFNRWMGEFVDPSRQVGVALINYLDVDAAVKEVYWAAGAGLRSVALNGVQTNVPPPWDESFTPLWKALEDTGLPISMHAGSGSSLPQPLHIYDPDKKLEALRTMGPLMWAINITEGLISSHRPLWFFIWGGVIDRHPKLKLVFTEQGSGWIPKAIEYMDWQWEYSPHSESSLIPRRPSEYWAEQCFTGASIMTHYEVAHRHQIGVANMMFGTDFPHSEGTFGKTVSYLNHVLARTDVTESETRAILGENMARCYGLDMTYLQSLAEGVGPTVKEILTPTDTPVEDPETVMWANKPSFLF